MIKNEFNWENAREVTSTAGRKMPMFSITGNGYARINRSFKDKYKLTDIKSVKIKYNKREDKWIVGFMFFNNKEEGDFSVNEDPRTKCLWFSLRSLFNNIGIELNKFVPQKLNPEAISSDGKKIFVIELNLKERK